MLSKAQISTEDKQLSVKVVLSGEAATYPVQVSYSIGGTAGSEDYELSVDANVTEGSSQTSGTLIFEDGLEAELLLNILEDQLVEGDEQLVVTLSNPSNAVLDSNSQHQVTITESNIAPFVKLSAEQNGLTVTTISAEEGLVTISVDIEDINTSDSHELDWSATNNELADTDSNPMTLTFNPAGISQGVYTIHVSVEDNGSPRETSSATLNLRVIESHPTLSAELDSDGDGINDLSEGHQDSDLDGIADYLDPILGSTWLPQQVGSASQNPNSYLMQVEHGLSLSLGTLALLDHNGGASVSEETFIGSELFAQHGDDEDYDRVGSLFDFEISQVSPMGGSVQLVIPLQAAIPENASYRKLNPQTGWQDFTVDDRNQLYSAPGEAGVCPSPGDAAYQLGLMEGHYCMMMLIQDGGENDADGEANGTIVDPGHIAAIVKSVSQEPSSTKKKSGGGAVSIFWILCMALLVVTRRQQFTLRSR